MGVSLRRWGAAAKGVGSELGCGALWHPASDLSVFCAFLVYEVSCASLGGGCGNCRRPDLGTCLACELRHREAGHCEGGVSEQPGGRRAREMGAQAGDAPGLLGPALDGRVPSVESDFSDVGVRRLSQGSEAAPRRSRR